MSQPQSPAQDEQQHPSIFQRSLQALFTPFSPAALASLPRLSRPVRYTRADAIPETQPDSDGQRPTVRDYHAINLPPQVRVPKKVPTHIRVEGKVWFANERTWVSWLNISVLLATLSLALYNASKDDIATYFSYAYACISICTLVYSWVIYQHRITMIRRRDPGHFDALTGPIVLSVVLFSAVLANFIVRVRELQAKGIDLPGANFFGFTPYNINQSVVIPIHEQPLQHPF